MHKVLIVFLFLLLPFGAEASRGFLKRVKKDTGPIDVVYTWVDDQDPVWQKAKEASLAKIACGITHDAKSKVRFRNRDELKYSLRSVFANARFVHHIYIVTFGHQPSWLEPHPKITIVDHKEIFKNPDHLPTFNSQAIEANLHRIPNLSERFIYFNDDVFLGRKAARRDFFTRDGKIKLLCIDGATPKGALEPTDMAYTASWKNTNRFLDAHFGVSNREYLAHAPFALRKSLMNKFEALFPDIVDKVSSHTFRSPEDYVMTCGLIHYFALYQKHAKREKGNSPTVGFTNDLEQNRVALRALYDKRPRFFCIEDASDDADSPSAVFQLHQFLETYFPEKAPWER